MIQTTFLPHRTIPIEPGGYWQRAFNHLKGTQLTSSLHDSTLGSSVFYMSYKRP